MKKESIYSVTSLIIFTALILLLSGCSTSWKRIKADKENSSLRTSIEERLSLYTSMEEAYTATMAEERFQQGVSRNDIARMAFANQLYSSTALAELGIAKADLVQAGIYKNPYMLNTFNAASLNTAASNQNATIGTELDFSIADLWQLPKRKKVAQKDLTSKQLELTATIINQVVQIQRIYDTCLALQQKIIYAQERQKIIQHLIHDSQRSKTPSLGEKLTSNTLEATEVGWQLSLLKYEQDLQIAFSTLRAELILIPSLKPIQMTSQLAYAIAPLVDIAILEIAALEHSYEVALAQANVERAYAAIAYEHSKFFDQFLVGYIFEKNSDGTSNSGLEVDLSLPIFDNNRAGVARARFAHTKAEQELVIIKRKVLAKVQQLYLQLQVSHGMIPLYQTTITNYAKSLEIAGNTPSMEVIYLLAAQNIHQNIFDAQALLLDTYVQAYDNARQLEALTGMSIYKKATCDDEQQQPIEQPPLTLAHLTLPKNLQV